MELAEMLTVPRRIIGHICDSPQTPCHYEMESTDDVLIVQNEDNTHAQ